MRNGEHSQLLYRVYEVGTAHNVVVCPLSEVRIGGACNVFSLQAPPPAHRRYSSEKHVDKARHAHPHVRGEEPPRERKPRWDQREMGFVRTIVRCGVAGGRLWWGQQWRVD